MKPVLCSLVASALVLASSLAADSPDAKPDVWPQWRGPLATGVAPDADPPITWAKDKNLRWTASIPGRGHSSPIVWGDRVFVTTAATTEKTADPEAIKAAQAATPEFHRRSARMPRNVLQFTVIALDRRDGRVLWERTVCEASPHSGTHADGSWKASAWSTPLRSAPPAGCM